VKFKIHKLWTITRLANPYSINLVVSRKSIFETIKKKYRGGLNIAERFFAQKLGDIWQFWRYCHFRRYENKNIVFRSDIEDP
jgi:hypothetical protein